jgi:CheY-like chemotaxis protein
MRRPPGVLIVDDDEGVRRVLGAGLWHAGFAIWMATDGREAVEIYRSHRRGSISLVLLDVLMPGRDGVWTLAALRELDPLLRACFVTGGTGSYTEQDLLDLGAFAVFRKPLDLNELAERLLELTTPMDPSEGLQEGRWSDDGGPGTPASR